MAALAHSRELTNIPSPARSGVENPEEDDEALPTTEEDLKRLIAQKIEERDRMCATLDQEILQIRQALEALGKQKKEELKAHYHRRLGFAPPLRTARQQRLAAVLDRTFGTHDKLKEESVAIGAEREQRRQKELAKWSKYRDEQTGSDMWHNEDTGEIREVDPAEDFAEDDDAGGDAEYLRAADRSKSGGKTRRKRKKRKTKKRKTRKKKRRRKSCKRCKKKRRY